MIFFSLLRIPGNGRVVELLINWPIGHVCYEIEYFIKFCLVHVIKNDGKLIQDISKPC